MPYSLHQELKDGTLEVAFHYTLTKRAAISAAKACAKISGSDVGRIIVQDRNELTVATFPVRVRSRPPATATARTGK